MPSHVGVMSSQALREGRCITCSIWSRSTLAWPVEGRRCSIDQPDNSRTNPSARLHDTQAARHENFPCLPAMGEGAGSSADHNAAR
jgi:hypothetical protein